MYGLHASSFKPFTPESSRSTTNYPTKAAISTMKLSTFILLSVPALALAKGGGGRGGGGRRLSSSSSSGSGSGVTSKKPSKPSSNDASQEEDLYNNGVTRFGLPVGTHLGCFSRPKNAPEDVYIVDLTVQRCESHCTLLEGTLPWRVVGLQNGHCVCLHSLPPVKDQKKLDQCGSSCAGDRNGASRCMYTYHQSGFKLPYCN